MNKLSDIDIDRIIEMAWEDRTTFDAIKFQFGLSEQEVISLMRKEMKIKSFKLWRKRALVYLFDIELLDICLCLVHLNLPLSNSLSLLCFVFLP